jgi:hypothetical protein
MGHNFISVGEEYDGGYVYSGVNSAPGLNNLKWAHWLTNPGPAVEEGQVLLLQEYPWFDLAAGSRKFTFKSKGKLPRWMMRISASGMESAGSLEVWLDGEMLAWAPRGDLDRAFYEVLF